MSSNRNADNRSSRRVNIITQCDEDSSSDPPSSPPVDPSTVRHSCLTTSSVARRSNPDRIKRLSSVEASTRNLDDASGSSFSLSSNDDSSSSSEVDRGPKGKKKRSKRKKLKPKSGGGWWTKVSQAQKKALRKSCKKKGFNVKHKKTFKAGC